MHESQTRPLFIATGIALAVAVVIVVFSVDLSYCSSSHDVKSGNHRKTAPSLTEPLDRQLRLWLDADDLDKSLRAALEAEIAGAQQAIALIDDATDGGRVTVRVDDASFYTPLYARTSVTAVMDFETAPIPGTTMPWADGEARLQLSGACYGIVAPSRFRTRVASDIAAPLAKILKDALSAS